MGLYAGEIFKVINAFACDREFDPHFRLMTLMLKELVKALPKVVGFLRVLQFPPTDDVERVYWK